MPPSPWYASGLRFGCTSSGACCKNGGDYAYVYLERPELRDLAAHLGMSEDEFFDRYCTLDEGWTILRMDAPACPFLSDAGRCTVYAARPVQCRTWPFWAENLRSPEAWAEAAHRCPGVGRGRAYDADEIARIALANEAWAEGAHDVEVPATDDGPTREAGPREAQ